MASVELIVATPCLNSTQLSFILFWVSENGEWDIPRKELDDEPDVVANDLRKILLSDAQDIDTHFPMLQYIGLVGESHVYLWMIYARIRFEDCDCRQYRCTTASKADQEQRPSMGARRIFSELHDQLIAAGLKPGTVGLLAGRQ